MLAVFVCFGEFCLLAGWLFCCVLVVNSVVIAAITYSLFVRFVLICVFVVAW